MATWVHTHVYVVRSRQVRLVAKRDTGTRDLVCELQKRIGYSIFQDPATTRNKMKSGADAGMQRRGSVLPHLQGLVRVNQLLGV